jgi:type VI secretion system secreted protein VgrG
VQFHWDREGEWMPNSSCWVRVAQTWAGVGFGTMFVPRVGMEVVVTFLEGDPDRPLVTGCVYNGSNAPPVALPAHKTQSTIRTQSSPGGQGFNELRFEDAAGHEEVYLHAQKDLRERVRNNHSTDVGCDQTHRVGRDQRETVHRDQQLVVEGNRAVRVDRDESIVVRGNHSVQVDGRGGGAPHASLHVTGAYLVDATESITLRVGRSTLTIDGSKIHLLAAGGAQVVLTVDALVEAAAAVVHGRARAKITAPSTAIVGDQSVHVGPKAIAVVGETLLLSGERVASLAGAAVNVNATGDTSIRGGMVRIND